MLDSRVRPEHARRHGTLNHRRPVGDQLGFDVMPRPPIDQPGNRLAYGCRCYLIPVFEDDPVPSPIPDSPSMARWFDRASPREQRMVIGPDAWDAARDRYGSVRWLDVSDPATGELLGA